MARRYDTAAGTRAHELPVFDRLDPHPAGGPGRAERSRCRLYARLVDALLEAGIRPIPTLYHWDLPQALEEDGGWASRDTAWRFADYAALVARALGDRVGSWLLLNEPQVFLDKGYRTGEHAPGRADGPAFLRATHTANLAVGLGFRAVKALRPRARVGTAVYVAPCEPAGASADDTAAAERAHRFENVWFLEPALRGRYPDLLGGALLDRIGIEPHDLALARAPLDFIGLNIYNRRVVSADRDDLGGLGLAYRAPSGGGGTGSRTDLGWEVWPSAMYDIVMRLTRDYGAPVLEITENGCAYADGPGASGGVQDLRRIAYHRGYLESLAAALAAGADVRGYHVWSLLDNVEWTGGTVPRFGLVHVDFTTLARTIKASGHWYGRLAATGRLDERSDREA